MEAPNRVETLELTMSAAEFLEWEAQQERRHEYFDGRISLMPGTTLDHNRIVFNIVSAIDRKLDGSSTMFVSFLEIMVEVAAMSRYFYPDVVVTNDPSERGKTRLLKSPLVVIEVLSPSTERYDRTRKFAAYRRNPMLAQYSIVSTEETNAESYVRDGDAWTFHERDIDGALDIAPLDLSIPLREIYRGTSLLDIVS